MAKRFIDSDIFKSSFTRSLKVEYKLFWIYLLCDCNHSGIWEADFETASVKCGGKIQKELAAELFKSKVIVINDGGAWFIPGFIEFQYKGILSLKNSAHEKPIKDLMKFGFLTPLEDNIHFELKTDLVAPIYSPSIEGTKIKIKIRNNLNLNTNLNLNIKDENFDFLETYINMINSTFGRQYRKTAKLAPTFNARIKEGYTIDDMRNAAQNAAMDKFHQDNGFKHCTPEFFLRVDKLEKWMNANPPLNSFERTLQHIKDITT